MLCLVRVERELTAELYPHVGFIIANLQRPAEQVVKFYNGRCTAEQLIREGKAALRWTGPCCRAIRANAVRLQLFALGYDLANSLRRLALPDVVGQWCHRRYVVFQLAEGRCRGRSPAAILRRIERLRRPAPADVVMRPNGTAIANGGKAMARRQSAAPNQRRIDAGMGPAPIPLEASPRTEVRVDPRPVDEQHQPRWSMPPGGPR